MPKNCYYFDHHTAEQNAAGLVPLACLGDVFDVCSDNYCFCRAFLVTSIKSTFFPWAHVGALQVKTIKGLGIFAFILKYLSP